MFGIAVVSAPCGQLYEPGRHIQRGGAEEQRTETKTQRDQETIEDLETDCHWKRP